MVMEGVVVLVAPPKILEFVPAEKADPVPKALPPVDPNEAGFAGEPNALDGAAPNGEAPPMPPIVDPKGEVFGRLPKAEPGVFIPPIEELPNGCAAFAVVFIPPLALPQPIEVPAPAPPKPDKLLVTVLLVPNGFPNGEVLVLPPNADVPVFPNAP